jgi:hypothetical protein
LATRDSAAVKSTAPKIHICGGGAQLSMNAEIVGASSRASGVVCPCGP